MTATEMQAKYLAGRRQKAKDHLGGCCVVCGRIDSLEFDHIEPSSKEIEISNAIAKHWSWERLVPELEKCQLLCRDHHVEKTKSDGSSKGGGWNKTLEPGHGTSVMYHRMRCRCSACAEWKTLYRCGAVDSLGNLKVPPSRVAEIQDKRKPRGSRVCGTYASYKAGCKCSACREANRLYGRSLRNRARVAKSG